MKVGQFAPTDPLATYAQRTTELEARVAELERQASVLVASPPTVSGSRGGNAALADLLTELETLGLIVDTTTA